MKGERNRECKSKDLTDSDAAVVEMFVPERLFPVSLFLFP